MNTLNFEKIEAQVLETEQKVLECTGFAFEKAVATTEEDRKKGFLPATGYSWFMRICHPV